MHQQGALAYQRTAQQTMPPRSLEAELLSRAATRLQRIRDDWDANRGDLGAALMFNRKLWTVFLTAVTAEDCPHDLQLRQNVANLGIFIMNETREMLAEPVPNKLDSIIRINRNLAAGLRGSAAD